MKNLTDPRGNELFYQGLGPEAGPLPAFFYFALSGEESLKLDPYNSPVARLEGAPIRVFSMTLPGHGLGFNKLHAIQYWADQLAGGTDVLNKFFDDAAFAINWLIEEGWIEPDEIAVGGLSRGGFVATHVAALDPRIKTVLGFAPLTRLSAVKEFASEKQPTHAKMHALTLDLEQIVDNLTHLRHLRFYIGNRDERVGTDACYHFVRKLANKGHEKRARHMHAELFITHAIGHQGHGTAPHIFEAGADWVKDLLLR